MPAERPDDIPHLTVPHFVGGDEHSASENEIDADDNNQLPGYELLPNEPGQDGQSDNCDDDDDDDDNDDSGAVISAEPSENRIEENIVNNNNSQSHNAAALPFDSGIFRQFQETLNLADTVHLRSSDFPIEHRPRPDSLPMTSEHVETIKACMSKIVLPTSNHPQWANAVPEDEWKSHLLSKLNNSKS